MLFDLVVLELVIYCQKIIRDVFKDLLKYSYFIFVYIYDVYYSIYFIVKYKLFKIISNKVFLIYYDMFFQ